MLVGSFKGSMIIITSLLRIHCPVVVVVVVDVAAAVVVTFFWWGVVF
jgi:hypothetical protein